MRRATLDTPSPERYVAAELNTVGLQIQTNGYLPHAIMVSLDMWCVEPRTTSPKFDLCNVIFSSFIMISQKVNSSQINSS